MIIQIGIFRNRFIYLNLVSNISLKEHCLITNFNFFSLREIRNVSTVEGEATPTRSVPLPEEEQELREEELGGGGQGGSGQGSG